jgi:hypothetical protein
VYIILLGPSAVTVGPHVTFLYFLYQCLIINENNNVF